MQYTITEPITELFGRDIQPLTNGPCPTTSM